MANWKAEPASGSEYDVFLNFRGEDTRNNFTDFLHKGLVDAGFRAFKDEEELRYGDVISHELEHAINNSTLYIPIFSPNYASSKWCLRELKLIVDNVSASGGKKSILPIFFLVEPDDVKLKAQPDRVSLYKAAFEEHEKNYPEEYKAWKTALGTVDEHKGWVVDKKTSQAKIVESVVEKVLEKLGSRQQSVPECLVGLGDRVKHLIELLDVNHREVRLIGIYGMAGIGKTTIAKVVFNHLSIHFGKYCSFLEDIRESSSTKEGIVELQKKLLSNIVGSGSVEQFKDSEHGKRRIQNTLRTKKVLVVLDDVDKKEHIEKLLGNSSLHSGSRIIITTKNRAVMQVDGFKCKIQPYEMLKMDDGPALQLFYQHAFGGDFRLGDDHGLSSEIVSSTGGLPLTIEVIGSSLKGQNKAHWKETQAKLKNVPEEQILKKLMVSYDDLTKSQQQIFLDIACFFLNEKKTDAMCMWDKCSFYPETGIGALISKCLIKILDNKFWMHGQLIALGRHIVREKSSYDLSKQSRLWINEEALQIIKTKERKDKVQALSVMIEEITNEDFERFPNLRFLELQEGTYAGDFVGCHSNLRWFSWHSSPEEDIGADNFSLDGLVVCKLYTVKFKDDSKALGLIKRARDLKVLSFTQCHSITTIPDISKCSGLVRLTLEGCSSLKRIERFIGDLRSLTELKIEDCQNFKDLPEEVGKLVKLEHFSLSGCEKLRELPVSIGNLTSLTEFDLSDTIIKELPDFITKLKSLRILRFTIKEDTEDHEWQLPSSISNLVNLEELDLSGHNKMKGEVPDGIREMSSLRILNLESTGIRGIPRTINMLRQLQTLNLSGCHEIQELPELPTNLTCVRLESESLLSVPNLSNLTNLVDLLLSNYKHRGEKSKPLTGCDLKWIGSLSRLKKLKLNLTNVAAPPDLASLSHLEELSLSCLDLETQLPSSVRRLDFQFFSISSAELLPSCLRWTNLSRLEFHHGEVEDIPLAGLRQLEKLSICSCERLQRLSIPPELMKLQEVSVSSCPELAEIQVVGLLNSLKSICVSECKSLTRISGLQHLKNLENLAILCCSILTVVEGLDELESRSSSVIRECPSLSRHNIPFLVDMRELCSCESLEGWTVGRKRAAAWGKRASRAGGRSKKPKSEEWLEEDSPVPRIWSGAEEEEEVDEDEQAEEDEDVDEEEEVDEDEDAEEDEDADEEEEPSIEGFLLGSAEGEWLGEEEEEKEKEMEKVVVFKLDLRNEKDKKKAIKIVSGFAEVESFSVDMEDRELMVIGDIDEVLLASKLREWFDTQLMSIEAAS